MKKIMETKKAAVREPVVQDWLSYEFTEDDFLSGDKPEFSPDLWEAGE